LDDIKIVKIHNVLAFVRRQKNLCNSVVIVRPAYYEKLKVWTGIAISVLPLVLFYS
jgi:hypothetical protein